CLSPLHSDIRVGNVGTLFSVLTTTLFLCMQTDRTLVAGVLLGMCMAKPSFGIPALLIAVALRKWRAIFWSGLVGLLSNLVATWPLGLTGLRDALANLLILASPGGWGDHRPGNPLHHQLINLRSWTYGWLSPISADLLTVLIAATMFWALCHFRRAA